MGERGVQVAAGLSRHLVAWFLKHRYEVIAIIVITSVAAFFRTWQLESIPEGIHGDEATNALYADRILDGDFHEPYDRFHAHGRPAGFLYWLAGVTAIFGDSLLVIRLAAATLSILTIPVAYLLFRAIDGKSTAMIGSSFLAVSGWHVIYSRFAWEPGLLVLAEVVAALFVVLALRSEKRWHFALAGFALGLGFYSHTSYPFFLAAVAVVVAGWLVSKRRDLLRAIEGLATMVGAFLLAALPMLSYMWRHQDVFTRPSRSDSIFHTAPFQDAGFAKRVDIVLDAGRDFVRLAVFESPADLAIIAVPVSALLGLGLLYAAWRWREPGAALAALVVLIVPWVAILYPGGAGPSMRRAIGVVPFIALLAALPLGAALRTKYLTPMLPRALAVGAIVGVIAYAGVTDGRTYFDTYASRVSISLPMVEASRYMDGLPDGTYVYFFSSVWNYDQELRRYLAPDTPGEDRSGFWGSEFDLTPDRSRNVVYIFIGALLDTSDDVQLLYPDGRLVDHLDDDGVTLFRTYELPAERND